MSQPREYPSPTVATRLFFTSQLFRIVGLPQDVCDFFSKRRAEIVAYMESHGLKGAAAGSIAALETRPAKKHVAREELFLDWHRIGNSLGWGPDQARKLSRDKKVQEIMSQLIEPSAGEPNRGPSGQTQEAPTTSELRMRLAGKIKIAGLRMPVPIRAIQNGSKLNPRLLM